VIKCPFKKTDKDEQILKAASEEFMNKGLEAASMHNIACLAEVSKRTLYKYYPTKEELYTALIDVVLHQMQGLYNFDYEAEQNVIEQIEKIVDAKIELLLSNSFLRISKIVLSEMMKGRKPNDQQMQQFNESEIAFIAWIEKAQKDKKIKSNIEPSQVAEQFHSILKGQIYWPVILGFEEKDKLDLNKVRKSTVDFFRQFCL
jgi:TetR/AcrR family transcriptional regulator of autoinduction and epiphytic fitness